MSFGVGIFGLDHWYTALEALRLLESAKEARLIGIVETDEARRAWIGERHPGAPLTDAGALLESDECSLVLLCAPTSDAPALAKAALAAGKHVISVKPAARTLAELSEVLSLAQSAGRFFGSFEGVQRMHPRATILKELLSGGAIGTPLSFHQVGHGPLPSPWPGEPSGAPSWWTDSAKVPGGAWLDHAIYAVDLARFVLGGEVNFATGVLEKRLHPTLGLEDYGVSLMRLSGGEALIFEDTWAATPGAGYGRYFFLGTEGSLRLEKGAWVVARGAEETPHPIPDAPFIDFGALAAALTRGEALPFGPADARANLEACLRVYAAAPA